MPAEAKVPRKKLGSTGAEIPILLMGGGRGFDPLYDKRLHRAFKLGVDYIDTALHYARGQSHKAVAAFQKQVGRKNLWITSKVSLHGTRGTPESFRTKLDECLETLETDYLDMFFMHAIGPGDLHLLDREHIKMTEDMKKSGKIRFFGFSCHAGNVPEVMTTAATAGGVDALMFRYNFRDYGDIALTKAIDACKQAGIGLIAMKALASVPDDEAKVVGFTSKNFTLGQAKLKAVWADERIDAACVQMENVQQVMEDTAAALSPVQLSMAELHQLNRLAARTAAHYCRGCSHRCESQAAGTLRIAEVLRCLMYHDSYGDAETARVLYNALSGDERDPSGVDLAAAMAACPQGIDIARRLAEAKHRLSA